MNYQFCLKFQMTTSLNNDRQLLIFVYLIAGQVAQSGKCANFDKTLSDLVHYSWQFYSKQFGIQVVSLTKSSGANAQEAQVCLWDVCLCNRECHLNNTR